MPTASTSDKSTATATPDPDPVSVTSPRPTATSKIEDNTLTATDVESGHQVIAINAADGRPVVIDPSYTGTGDPTYQARATAAAVAADENTTEAESATGERTVTARETPEFLDAALVGMTGGAEMHPAITVRVLRMDHAFKVGSDQGAAGDYLVELPDGKRFKATPAEVESSFVPA